jgi:Uncharacterized conserved protein
MKILRKIKYIKIKVFWVGKNNRQETLKTNTTIQPEKSLKLMRSANPLVIPRNHKVEEALEAANNDDLNPNEKYYLKF